MGSIYNCITPTMYSAVVARIVNTGAMLLRAAALLKSRLAVTLETSLPLLALPPLPALPPLLALPPLPALPPLLDFALLDPLPLLPPLPLDVPRPVTLKVGAGVPLWRLGLEVVRKKLLLAIGTAVGLLATGLIEGGAVAAII